MPDPYKQAYYEDAMTAESARRVLPFVVDRYRPASAVDIGCGNGVWLEELRRLGVADLRGVDGAQSRFNPAELVVADLASAFPPLNQRFDLCLCLEVGEHLPVARSESFVDYLSSLANTIIFSAAIPGQGGHGHQNCQFQGWWAEKFRRRGFRPLDWLRTEIWNDDKIASFYRQNIMALEYVPESPYSVFQDVVHPDFYIYRMQTLKGFGWGI